MRGGGGVLPLALGDGHLQPGLHEGQAEDRGTLPWGHSCQVSHTNVVTKALDTISYLERAHLTIRRQTLTKITKHAPYTIFSRDSRDNACLTYGTGRSTTFLTVNLLTPAKHKAFCGVSYNNVSLPWDRCFVFDAGACIWL